MNVLVTRFYINDPIQPVPLIPTRNPAMLERWEELSEIQREVVREFRKEDLQKIRLISLYSLIPLVALSFGGGYIISGQMLYPIKKLNREMKRKTPDTLDQKIVHHDVGDEISELINNFNNMTARLGEAFSLQKQFVENASHELKTPLAVIRTNLDTALLDAKISKSELHSYIHSSIDSVTFMNKLIEDLLLLSLLERQIKKSRVDIGKIIKDATQQLAIFAGKNNIELQSKVDSAKVVVEGNEELLQRAVMNIVENAIKYSPKDGVVKIQGKKKESDYQVSVTDQGEGIPPKDIEHIFDRFYRVDKSRSRKSGGSGLGLAITQKIIKMHDGTITVRSEEGKGSTFTISIPLTTEPPNSKKQKPPSKR